jgi:hypothetical protein
VNCKGVMVRAGGEVGDREISEWYCLIYGELSLASLSGFTLSLTRVTVVPGCFWVSAEPAPSEPGSRSPAQNQPGTEQSAIDEPHVVGKAMASRSMRLKS